MIWKAWTNGSNGFGFDIDVADRDAYFSKAWKFVDVDLPTSSGYQTVTCLVAKQSFWKPLAPCIHVINKDIGTWLAANNFSVWAKNQPPTFHVINLGVVISECSDLEWG